MSGPNTAADVSTAPDRDGAHLGQSKCELVRSIQGLCARFLAAMRAHEKRGKAGRGRIPVAPVRSQLGGLAESQRHLARFELSVHHSDASQPVGVFQKESRSRLGAAEAGAVAMARAITRIGRTAML
jgi:hypothetical protein